MSREANRELIGEFAYAYWGPNQIDTGLSDGAILAATWQELCVIDLDVPLAADMYEYNDRVSLGMKEFAPDRLTFSIDFSINALRQPVNDRILWDNTYWGFFPLAFMALTRRKDQDLTYGFVGNLVGTVMSEQQPASGPINERYSLVPARRSNYAITVRRIYGPGFP